MWCLLFCCVVHSICLKDCSNSPQIYLQPAALSRSSGRVVKCTLCKGVGHSARTCLLAGTDGGIPALQESWRSTVAAILRMCQNTATTLPQQTCFHLVMIWRLARLVVHHGSLLSSQSLIMKWYTISVQLLVRLSSISTFLTNERTRMWEKSTQGWTQCSVVSQHHASRHQDHMEHVCATIWRTIRICFSQHIWGRFGGRLWPKPIPTPHPRVAHTATYLRWRNVRILQVLFCILA